MITTTASRPSTSTKKPLESHFKTDDSGRLEISEEIKVSSRKSKKEVEGNANMDQDSMGAYLEAMRGDDGHTRDAKGKARFNKSQGKRGRGEDEEEVQESLDPLRNTGRREKKAKKETVKIGAEFKAKVSCPFHQQSPVN
jgi:ribosomal RNA-processing protein 12